MSVLIIIKKLPVNETTCSKARMILEINKARKELRT
jgi:hypothetical protein